MKQNTVGYREHIVSNAKAMVRNNELFQIICENPSDNATLDMMSWVLVYYALLHYGYPTQVYPSGDELKMWHSDVYKYLVRREKEHRNKITE